jgi:hypothetical protein
LAKGVTYNEALAEADKVERRERRRAGDVRRLTHHGWELPDSREVHERLWKKLENGVSVWIVNGRLVRSVFDIDFTEGGHDYVYEFVPENEVWIDDDIEEKERGYVLLHELHERNRMAGGWPYNKAHAEWGLERSGQARSLSYSGPTPFQPLLPSKHDRPRQMPLGSSPGLPWQ